LLLNIGMPLVTEAGSVAGSGLGSSIGPYSCPRHVVELDRFRSSWMYFRPNSKVVQYNLHLSEGE
jgi:hypothetical protein